MSGDLGDISNVDPAVIVDICAFLFLFIEFLFVLDVRHNFGDIGDIDNAVIVYIPFEGGAFNIVSRTECCIGRALLQDF